MLSNKDLDYTITTTLIRSSPVQHVNTLVVSEPILVDPVIKHMESNRNSYASSHIRGLKHSKQLIPNISSYRCYGFDLLDVSTSWWPCPPTTDVYNTSKTDAATLNSYVSDDNKYTSSLFHPSSYERGFNTSAYVGIFLCTFGIFLNLLLFATLLSSRRLRLQYLYVQVLNIALADLSYIVTVDSFTIYFELQSWQLGAAFCKTWMILDVALPSVSLFALLLLNLDRIAFAYKTSFYQLLMQKKVSRIMILLGPWCISCFIVNTLWLGFPAEEEYLPGACVYGITKEANVASIWLTVFLPSLLIFVLLIFIFIAGIGEMPTAELTPSSQQSINDSAALSSQAQPVTKVSDQETGQTPSLGRIQSSLTAPATSISYSGRQRRFVAALLAVDFISLAITLPYSAYSQVSINCMSPQSCQSFVALFQILSWMKSSITCVRPVFFILLTDIYLSLKKRFSRTFLRRRHNRGTLLDASQRRKPDSLITGGKRNYENINLTPVNFRSLYSRNSSTTTTFTTSSQSPGQSKALLEKQTQKTNATNVYCNDERTGTFV